jgi:tetratricopeptide (TPR) repeat protein
MVDRMETQIDLLSAIHGTLQAPLMTQVRELFKLGQDHYKKGLLDKALEAFLRAEQKNDVDFPLQLQIGKLFLYGRSRSVDVVDLNKAAQHLLLAARYAEAEQSTVPKWRQYCGEAYFHAGVATYLMGEPEQAAGRLDSMCAHLERALEYLSRAGSLCPDFTEIFYTRAKCYALLGRTAEALGEFELLSDRDRRYLAKAEQDRDFDALRADVERVFLQAIASPGPRALAAKAQLDAARDAVAWARISEPDPNDLAKVVSIERTLDSDEKALVGVDVVIVSLQHRTKSAAQEAEAIAEKSFGNAEKSFRDRIRAFEHKAASLRTEKTRREHALEGKRQAINQAGGSAGMGCLCAVLIVFFWNILMVSAFTSLSPSRPSGALWNLSGIVLAIGAFIGVFRSSKATKARELRRQVEALTKEINEWDSVVAPIAQDAEKQAAKLNGQLSDLLSRHAQYQAATGRGAVAPPPSTSLRRIRS